MGHGNTPQYAPLVILYTDTNNTKKARVVIGKAFIFLSGVHYACENPMKGTND